MAKIVINDDKIIESYMTFNDNLENVENEAIEDGKAVAYQRGLSEKNTNELVELMKKFAREKVEDSIAFWNKLEDMGFIDFVVEDNDVVQAVNEDGSVVDFDLNGDVING